MAETKVIELPVPAMVDKSPLMHGSWWRLLPADMTAGVSHVALGDSHDDAWLCSEKDGAARRVWRLPVDGWQLAREELHQCIVDDIRPINGMAFSDPWVAISSVTGLTVQYKSSMVRRLLDQGVPADFATIKLSTGIGCHDVLAGSRGRFYAACGVNGVVVLEASRRGAPGSEQIELSRFHTSGLYPYRLCPVRSMGHLDTFAVACRTGGVRFMTFPDGEGYKNHSVAHFTDPIDDCVDVIPLERGSDKVLALGRDGDVSVIEFDTRLASLYARVITETGCPAHSIHRVGKHTIILTSTGLIVYVDLDVTARLQERPRVLKGTHHAMTIPVEAVSATVVEGRNLMVATADERVWCLDINKLVSLNR